MSRSGRTTSDQAAWLRVYAAAIGPAMSHHLKETTPGQGGAEGALSAASVLAAWAANEAVVIFNERFPPRPFTGGSPFDPPLSDSPAEPSFVEQLTRDGWRGVREKEALRRKWDPAAPQKCLMCGVTISRLPPCPPGDGFMLCDQCARPAVPDEGDRQG